MAPLKFKASPQGCKFCNRKSLHFSKVAPLLSVASSTSATNSLQYLTTHQACICYGFQITYYAQEQWSGFLPILLLSCSINLIFHNFPPFILLNSQNGTFMNITNLSNFSAIKNLQYTTAIYRSIILNGALRIYEFSLRYIHSYTQYLPSTKTMKPAPFILIIDGTS